MRAKSPALDRFRIAAAVLVAAIHTSPLTTYTADGDFFLTRVLARLAVPFFFLVTGYFLSRSEWNSLPRFLKKTGLLYLAAMLFYLPLNLYSRNLSGWQNIVRGILFDGTFYHLWYFPAVLLGSLLAFLLSRKGPRFALTAAGLLYLIGLGGDSYYGLVSSLPFGKAFYDILFSLSAYTRNGIFFAPLFLLLGAYAKRRNPRLCLVGFLLSFAAMSVEAFLLRAAEAQRHNSMYLLLPFCSLFLFSLLLSRNSGQNRDARRFSAVFYVIHPWCIVLVRGGAEMLGLEAVLVSNSLGHFLAVLLFSAAVSLSAVFFLPRRPSETGRAWCEIDLRALRSNTFLLQRKAGVHSALMAVIKADAYGHGAIPCARALRRCGVRAFAVATLEEGITLRRAAVRGTILILGYTPPSEADLLVRWRLTQAVMDEPYARQLAAQGRRVAVHVAVDTGMHRIGIPVEEVAAFRRVYRLPICALRGFFPTSAPRTDALLRRKALHKCRQTPSCSWYPFCAPAAVLWGTHICWPARESCAFRSSPALMCARGWRCSAHGKHRRNGMKAAGFALYYLCAPGLSLFAVSKRENAPGMVWRLKPNVPPFWPPSPSAMRTAFRAAWPHRAGRFFCMGSAFPWWAGSAWISF